MKDAKILIQSCFVAILCINSTSIWIHILHNHEMLRILATHEAKMTNLWTFCLLFVFKSNIELAKIGKAVTYNIFF